MMKSMIGKTLGVWRFYLISLAVIAVDQVVKMVVHFTMQMGVRGQVKIFGDWFKLHYLTNPGMAFGIELPIENSKIGLTIFRFIAAFAIGYYLFLMHKRRFPGGFLVCVALILGGAIGNLIDSVFYGIWLDNAPYNAPTPWFFGQVVDMFYIDIWEGRLPGWLPVMGDSYLALWPIFNVADASIFTGVAVILIGQKTFFKEQHKAPADRPVNVGDTTEKPAG